MTAGVERTLERVEGLAHPTATVPMTPTVRGCVTSQRLIKSFFEKQETLKVFSVKSRVLKHLVTFEALQRVVVESL